MMSKTTNKFSPEVRERAIRMVLDHTENIPRAGRRLCRSRRRSAFGADAERVGEEVGDRRRQACGVPIEVVEKLKALERENRELRQANEILRKASAYFALAELDRPFRR